MFKLSTVMGLAVLATLCWTTPVGAAPPDVATQLGVSYELQITRIHTPFKDWPGSDNQLSWINFMPAYPARATLIPRGRMIWVDEGSVLYKAGLRTGDVITAVGSDEVLKVGQELAEVLNKNEVKGKVQLRVRHFREGYWVKERPAAPQGILSDVDESKMPPGYEDREISVALAK